MTLPQIFIPEKTPPLCWAEEFLVQHGCTCIPNAGGADGILLPVPFRKPLPENLTPGIPVFGGFLQTPDTGTNPIRNLLEDEGYVCENARLTAECAIRLASEQLPRVWNHCPVLILGSGRIAKFLAEMLRKTNAEVTIALRNARTQAFLSAAGFHTVSIEQARKDLSRWRVVFNTIPAPVLSAEDTAGHAGLLIDLASVPGIEGNRVISARGLPGKMVPESAGTLIGRTVLGYFIKEEVL